MRHWPNRWELWFNPSTLSFRIIVRKMPFVTKVKTDDKIIEIQSQSKAIANTKFRQKILPFKMCFSFSRRIYIQRPYICRVDKESAFEIPDNRKPEFGRHI